MTKTSKLLKKALRLLRAPLRSQLPRMAALTAMSASVLVLGAILWPFPDFTPGDTLLYCMDVLGVQFVLCWLLMVGVCALPRRAGTWAYWIVFGVMALSTAIDVVCYGFLNRPYSSLLVMLVAGTNLDEASGFFRLYFRWDAVWLAVSAAALTVGAWYGCRWFVRRGYALRRWLVTTLILVNLAWVVGLAVRYEKGNRRESAFGVVYKIYSLFIFEKSHSIVPANPKLETIGEQPQTVVVIFGESLVREHCSTLSYNLPTQPRMQARIDRGEVTAFANVLSPESETIHCFKRIMSTFEREDQERQWWNCPSLIEVARLNGYTTIWLSNQSKCGIYDNLVARYAEYADRSVFTVNTSLRESSDPLPYDDALLPLIESEHPASATDKRVYFIHLLGSHHYWYDRFPDSFRYFKKSDYLSRPEHQRSNFADYDNAVRYGDYVVDKIISEFEDQEAIVIYFPDHGLDFYATDDYFCGHGSVGESEESPSHHIGMWIYMSPAYRERFPEITERIEKAADRHFNTSDFIYTFMDIIGTRFVEPEFAAPERSLLYKTL